MSDAAGLVPVPASVDVCGLVGASSVTLRVAFWAPSRLGVKVISIAQLMPGASTKLVEGQCPAVEELTIAKSPPAAMPFTVSGPVPELLRTACLTALVVPTFWWPKSISDGVSVAPGVGIGRTMVQAPRPWVQATRFWSSWVSVIWSTRTVGMPVPSGTQLSVNGADPPQKVQIIVPRSVPM